MRQSFFGQYLVREGAITQGELEQAVRHQKQSNALLGRLAVEQGLLTADQVHAVLERQQQTSVRFGELAVAMDFFSSLELLELLASQADNHMYLGEALIAESILPQEAVVRHLDEFHKNLQAYERSFLEELHRADPQGVLLQVYEVVTAYFFHIGFVAKPVSIHDSLPPENGDECLFLEQKHPKGVSYLGLVIPECLLRQIASPLREQGEGGFEADREVAREVLFNLNYRLCENLRSSGMRVRHGALLPHLPKQMSHCSVMTFQTVADGFAVAYCR